MSYYFDGLSSDVLRHRALLNQVPWIWHVFEWSMEPGRLFSVFRLFWTIILLLIVTCIRICDRLRWAFGRLSFTSLFSNNCPCSSIFQGSVFHSDLWRIWIPGENVKCNSQGIGSLYGLFHRLHCLFCHGLPYSIGSYRYNRTMWKRYYRWRSNCWLCLNYKCNRNWPTRKGKTLIKKICFPSLPWIE